MDPSVGNFEVADVLIEGKKIIEVRPHIEANARVIDARGMVVLPGLIDTHHHQYQIIIRGIVGGTIVADADERRVIWPHDNHRTVVQGIWTTGRIGPPHNPTWDLGRSPMEPEDCYICELVASVSQINQGITCGVDASQASHTPEHTDAMIQGLMDSGRRGLYAYCPGRADQPGYEFPGVAGDETRGLGRLRRQFFSSDDQLVTLAHAGSGPEAWALARSFAVGVNTHNHDGDDIASNARLLGDDLTMVHCTRWSKEAWRVAADKGVHISIANVIETQTECTVPPLQSALDHGILPSLSVGAEAYTTADLLSQMRNALHLQHAHIHQRFAADEPDLPPLLTCGQVLKMATHAGAVGTRLSHKVGTLSPGKEADVIMLDGRALNVMPLTNAPNAVVTMMDSSNVDTVLIAGTLKKWKGKLIGVNVQKLREQIEASRERVLARIHAVPMPATSRLPPYVYTPLLLGVEHPSEPYAAMP